MSFIIRHLQEDLVVVCDNAWFDVMSGNCSCISRCDGMKRWFPIVNYAVVEVQPELQLNEVGGAITKQHMPILTTVKMATCHMTCLCMDAQDCVTTNCGRRSLEHGRVGA